MAEPVPHAGPATRLDAEIDQAVIKEHGGAPHHETFLGLDSYAWVGVAFVIFVAILWRAGAFRAIVAALDSRAARVRADLAEAANLRAEAEAMRATAVAEARQAEADAATIVANARVEAGHILERAEADSATLIERRTRMAEDRIAAEAREAEAVLRARAADLTLRAARSVLAERAARGELAGLVDSAIQGLDRR